MKNISANDVFGSKSELILVLFMVGVLLVLFTPIPSFVLDFLLILNFAFGLLILLLTFYIDRPIGFSTFPSILLMATLFRLSLNIAATRLILSDADAGQVIGAVGAYVIEGNYVIGLVVFLILIVVQFVVVTSGAQRVAEVAARFTLDSLPGKQMSIDADLNMGLIDEKDAQQRRKDIEREANFYGSMDGASKFVKGDAVAGIIIILIDIIGGLAIGVAQKGMSWSEALHTYTLLTVGDGIVTQIPALVISTATGIIVTRAASDAFFGEELANQIGQYPKSLSMVVIFLLGILFLPGIPATPVLFFIMAGIALFYAAYKVNKNSEGAVGKVDSNIQNEESEDLYSSMKVAPLSIEVGRNLVNMVGDDQGLFLAKIKSLRKQYANDMGFVFPEVVINDSKSISENHYLIKIFGSKVGEGDIYPDRQMAITTEKISGLAGIVTKDPSYGLPAVWIESTEEDSAKSLGCTLVGPIAVLATHFSELIKHHAKDLLDISEVTKILSRIRSENQFLYDELIPNLMTISDVQKVLKNLLHEKISIRNIELIFEALIDGARTTKSSEDLTEVARQRLSSSICENLLSKENELNVLTFDVDLERSLHMSIRSDENTAPILLLDPMIMEKVLVKIASQCDRMLKINLKPVLLCSPALRRHIKKLVERVAPHLYVISLAEVPGNITLKSTDIIRLD